jgi:hypothetical protein
MGRRSQYKKRISRKKNRGLRRGSRRRQRGGAARKTIIFNLTNTAGFGSVLGFLLQCYIYAKENGYKFVVKEDGWTYTHSKGWHDYFKTLEEYDSSAKYGEQESYKHGSVEGVPKYSLRKFNEAIKEIFILNDDLMGRVQSFIDEIGGPYVSIYVRRGDKVGGNCKEMDAIDLDSLIKDTGIEQGNVFVMTDDYSVVEEVKKLLPACKIFTMTEPVSRGADADVLRNNGPEQRKKHAEELLSSMEVFNRGEKGWTDNRSNLGRLLKMRGLDKIVLYPMDEASKNIPLDKEVDPPINPL